MSYVLHEPPETLLVQQKVLMSFWNYLHSSSRLISQYHRRLNHQLPQPLKFDHQFLVTTEDFIISFLRPQTMRLCISGFPLSLLKI